MSEVYTPRRALDEIETQHQQLRDLMARCDELADAVGAGRLGILALGRPVAHLREAFEAHNRYEEQLLRPALLRGHALDHTRIQRMVDEHVGEHRAMGAALETTQTSALRDVIHIMRTHITAEERFFATAVALASR